jgi:hypothetical protein
MADQIPLRELSVPQLRARAAAYFRKAETTTTTQAAAGFAKLGAYYAALAAERDAEEKRLRTGSEVLHDEAQR